MTVHIPSSHIYDTKAAANTLSQGDVIFLSDELKKEFLKHFKFDFDPEYLMIINQSCDLEYKAKIGDILSTLFDRVAVTELVEVNNWNKKKLYSSIGKMFEKYGLLEASKEVINKFPSVNKITIIDAIQEIEKLAIEIDEEKTRRQLKSTLDKWKPVIVDLIKDCIKDNTLIKLGDDQLKNKLSKLFDQKIY